MNLFLIILASYTTISAVLYILMSKNYKRHPVLHMPKRKSTYYLLSFVWGFPMVLIGLIVALVFVIAGKRPKKYGWNWYFEVNSNWGLELGIFFIVPINSQHLIKNHEHGHSIQNIYLGIFTPAVVSIPSAVRFWVREFKRSVLKQENTPYDSVWFEEQASLSGTAFISRVENDK